MKEDSSVGQPGNFVDRLSGSRTGAGLVPACPWASCLVFDPSRGGSTVVHPLSSLPTFLGAARCDDRRRPSTLLVSPVERNPSLPPRAPSWRKSSRHPCRPAHVRRFAGLGSARRPTTEAARAASTASRGSDLPARRRFRRFGRETGHALSMCNWKSSADDTRRCHGTPCQAEAAGTPEVIEDQLSSGGSLTEVSMFRETIKVVSEGALWDERCI